MYPFLFTLLDLDLLFKRPFKVNGYTLLSLIALKFTYAYQYMKNICIIIYIKKKLIKHISPPYPYPIFLRIVIPPYNTRTLKHTRASLLLCVCYGCIMFTNLFVCLILPPLLFSVVVLFP